MATCNYRVHKSSLSGEISPPPSKSQTLRALLFALMAQGTSIIRNPLFSPDTEKMIQAIIAFGAAVTCYTDRIEVIGTAGKISTPQDVIDAGNSGLVLRFMGAIAALCPGYTVLTGDTSIKLRRPIKPLCDAILQLGGFATSAALNDHPPLIVKGPMHAGSALLDGQDSQPVSSLLISASFLPGTTHLTVTNPGEKPWIAMTLSWLDFLKIGYTHENFEQYTLYGHAAYKGFDVTIKADFSSASFAIAAAVITNSALTVHNLDYSDPQGDKAFIDLLIRMGANITKTASSCIVEQGHNLQGGVIDINHCIDATPLLAVVACFAKTPTEIVNAAIARTKESDRLSAITQELKKMGANIEEKEDGLSIIPTALKGTTLFSHLDHRIAMALTVAALGAGGSSMIEDVACIQKSYPPFAEHFCQIGARLEMVT